MLVLTRRIGEEIVIGDNIRVKIVSVKGDRIRVGIDAPSEVSVDRAEIHSRRMEFHCVPDESTLVNSRSRLEDALHLEADVQIGVLPPSQNDAEETLIH